MRTPAAVDLDGNPIAPPTAATDAAPENGAPVQIALEARAATPIEWVVQDLIAVGGVYLFAGSPKLGRKSWAALSLAGAVSRGLPWIGRRTFARPALYVVLEDGPARLRRRAKMLGFAAPEWEHAPFYTSYWIAGLERIEQKLAQKGNQPVFVVIDPLAEIIAARNADENDSADMTNLLRPYREWAQATGAAIILIHHYRKGGDEMRGSSALMAACDGWCGFEPTEQDKDLLILTWTLRDAPFARIGARFVEENGVLRIEAAEIPEGTSLRSERGNGAGKGGTSSRTTAARVNPVQRDAMDRDLVLAYMREPGRGVVTVKSLVEALRAAAKDESAVLSDARAERALEALRGYGLRAVAGASGRYEIDPNHV